MKLKAACSLEEKLCKSRQHIKKQRHYFTNKGLSSQSYGFSSNHVWILELDLRESWVPRIHAFELWCWRKLLRVPWISKKIKPVNPKINQCWKFIGRTDAEAEAPVLRPPNAKNWLIGKDPYAEKDWRREEKGTTEDEMIGWHHQIDGHEFEQALGVGDGEGSLVCYSPWGHKEPDTSEWLNWTDTGKKCVFCYRWVECPINTSYIKLIDSA